MKTDWGAAAQVKDRQGNVYSNLNDQTIFIPSSIFEPQSVIILSTSRDVCQAGETHKEGHTLDQPRNVARFACFEDICSTSSFLSCVSYSATAYQILSQSCSRIFVFDIVFYCFVLYGL
jgi:hypothetical protein